MGCVDPLAAHVLMIEQVAQRADEFDVIHFHVAPLHFPLARRLPTPHLTTLHGRLDLPDLVPLYEEFSDMPLVSISDAQRAPLPDRTGGHRPSWLPRARLLDFTRSRVLPRLSRPHLAGEASRSRHRDRRRRAAAAARSPRRSIRPTSLYFKNEIAPLMEHPLVEFIGEIADREKSEFLGSARALLFPIDWPEPFGLVMIESLACGTPVVAFRGGSVAEVIDDGVTGFVVDDR